MSKELVIGDYARELASTRRMLAGLPDDRLDWRPHERSMSLGGLATHIANLLGWQAEILRRREFDLARVPPRRDPLRTGDAILEEFDARSVELERLLDEVELPALHDTWILRRGDQILFRAPRGIALRTFGLGHLIHHRGQLSLYRRLLGLPVPGMYGPSADDEEREARAAIEDAQSDTPVV